MNRRALLLFALVSIFWGIPYFFIKVALKDVSAYELACIRTAIGSLMFVPIALWREGFQGARGRMGDLAFLAAMEVTLPFVLIARGEQVISSSLTGILIATEPLLLALLAIRFDRSERAGGRRLAGMLVGLVGVSILLGFGGIGGSGLTGAGMVLFATFLYAAGALYIKVRLSDVPSTAVVAGTLGFSTIYLAVPAVLTAKHHVPGVDVIVALLILGVVCTGLGFLLFFALISEVGAGRATLITYVAPAVAVALGVTFRGESVTIATVVGLILILSGSWFASWSNPTRSRGRQEVVLS